MTDVAVRKRCFQGFVEIVVQDMVSKDVTQIWNRKRGGKNKICGEDGMLGKMTVGLSNVKKVQTGWQDRGAGSR